MENNGLIIEERLARLEVKSSAHTAALSFLVMALGENDATLAEKLRSQAAAIDAAPGLIDEQKEVVTNLFITLAACAQGGRPL